MQRMSQLVIYEELLKDKLLITYQSMIEKEDGVQEHYYDLVRGLLQKGETLEAYIYRKMIETTSKVIERLSGQVEPTPLDYACLKNDLTVIRYLINYDVESIVGQIDNQHNLMKYISEGMEHKPYAIAYSAFFKGIKDGLIGHEQCDDFIQLLRAYGTGVYAGHFAYSLNHDETIAPIEHYQSLDWSHIYDYEVQKEKLLLNTKALIEGRPFHHALLVGSSGTGKSSSVKAVAEKYKGGKLRLLQLYKGQLRHLPKLLKSLKDSPFKFIVFIDDLSFEVNEDEYKFLKSFIEGGINNDATNVAFYVTSNRRHLIKEVRSEREGDIHIQDFIQEMTSLSGRFGLNLTYEGLTQPAYLDMVFKMLDDKGIVYEKERILIEAKRYSIRQGGMSGRIANQFVKQMEMMGA